MQDRPDKIELLHGVEHFLNEEAIAQLAGPAQFHARVAAGVVRMVAREIELEEDDLRAELDGLRALLDAPGPALNRLEAVRREVLALNERLTEAIRRGEADGGEFRASVLDHLRRVTLRKLAVTDPPLAERLTRELA